MGNNNVYGEGHFITPHKVTKPIHMDQNAVNMENLFGKLNIATARAQKASQSQPQDLQKSFITYIKHYQRIEQIRIIEPEHNQPLSEKINNQQKVQQKIIIPKKARTQLAPSLDISKVDISKFMSRQDSPIKQQNYSPEQSRIQVFQSRMQNKYFKITK